MAEAEHLRETDSAPDLRLNRQQWLLILGFAVVIAASCRDMHLNTDSLHYLDMARTLIREHTIGTWHLTLNAEHVPSTEMLWPPLYGILLAGPLALGLSPETATTVIAVVSLIALLVMVVAVSRRVEWGLLVGLLLIHMTFKSGIAFRAFSETPFMALTFGALLAMALALQQDPPRSWRSRVIRLAFLAGILAGLAGLCRYIGLVVPVALGIVALIGPVRPQVDALRVRIGALLAMAVGTALPLGLWFARQAAVGSNFLGPDRPPSLLSLAEILQIFGQSAYTEAAALLIVLAAVTLGYHLLEWDEEPNRRAFVLCLVGAAVIYAVMHEAGTIASHATYRMDNPPEARQFFPGYAAVLLIVAALLHRARPPDDVLRRRRLIATILVLPLLAAPLAATYSGHDLTPERTTVTAWVDLNTGPNDLIIGWHVWPIRFYTQRPVLQDGMVTQPSVYDGPAVGAFLHKFGDHFGDVWLMVPIQRNPAAETIASYEQAGLHTHFITSLNVRGVRHYPGVREIRVYRVTGWRK